MNWLSTQFHALLAWFAGIGAVVFNLVTAIGTSIAQNGGPVLVQAALDGVAAAEKAGGTAAEKLAAAQAAVIADLTSKGLPVVMNAVNGAIEAAVAKMKADQAAIQAANAALAPQATS